MRDVWRFTRYLALLVAASQRGEEHGSVCSDYRKLEIDESVEGEQCTSPTSFNEHTLSVAHEISEWLRAHTQWALTAEDSETFKRRTGGERSATFGHVTVDGVASLLGEWRRCLPPAI